MYIKRIKKLFFILSILNIPSIFSFANEATKQFPGEGYDSFLKSFQGNCLTEDLNKLYYIGQNTGNVYYYDQTSEQMEHRLNSRGSGGVNLRILSGNTEISLSREYSSNNTNMSLVYQNILQGKSAILNAPVLTDLGKISMGLTSYEKRKNCGDQFISGIHLGARFLSNIKLFFRDEETKNRFKVTVSFRVLWKTITKNVIDESLHQFKNDVSISVSAVQFGGNTNEFQNYLARLGGQPNCTIDNLLPCQTYFQALLNYSSKGFSEQLNDMKYSLNPEEGPIALSYDFSEYSKLGFPDLASNIIDNPEWQENIKQRDALIEIQNKIEEEHQNKERANQFILNQKTFLLTENQVQSIQELMDKSIYNISRLKLAKESCLFNKEKCIEIKKTIFTQLVEYDMAILSPRKL